MFPFLFLGFTPPFVLPEAKIAEPAPIVEEVKVTQIEESIPILVEENVQQAAIENHIQQEIQKDILQSEPKEKITPMVFPKILSEAWLIGDVKSGKIFAEGRADVQVPIASLTKLVTAMVAFDHYALDAHVRISRSAAGIEGSEAGLRTGDDVLVKDLIYAALIKSGNDAALALAEYAPGGKKVFVQWMNEKVITLGLANTSFQNSIGFDHSRQYSTARDLFVISRTIVAKYPVLMDAVGQKTYTFQTKAGRSITVETTNKLFDSFLHIKGMKTGTTEGAGESFIGLAEGEQGQLVLAILLRSPNRFEEAKVGLWWALAMWQW